VFLKLTVYVFGLLATWAATFRLHSARSRQILWLLVSYVLYVTWGPWFLCLLIFSSLMNYALGEYLRRSRTSGRLWLAFGFNFLLLGTFKYLPAIASFAPSTSALYRLHGLLLPLGISFWTFQALSYLFDIYRDEDLDPSLLEFCLYMVFWPTVISGPICRLGSLLPQFRDARDPRWNDIATGTRRICIGVLLIVAAELLDSGLGRGQGVTASFERTNATWSGVDVWALAIGYGFLLFFDFAGYSHLVIGAARLFGIELQENFDRPYLCTTPSTFWTRWHMSLSFWIRDYVFLPLATRRHNLWWRNLVLVISMILFGLWHGASRLLILWGAYHGFLLVAHRQWQQLQRRMDLQVPNWASTPVSWAITFAAISLGWIFFRARDLHQAASMLAAVLSLHTYSSPTLSASFYLLTLFAAFAYFFSLSVGWLLDRSAKSVFIPRQLRPAVDLLANERWVWVAPLAGVAALYTFMLAEPSQSTTSPFLYRLF
jgi:alginate O-acetyltransferase complex protein AlgI